LTLLEEEVFARMAVHNLPPSQRLPMLRSAAQDAVAGGRIYDSHIADIARASGARVVSLTTGVILSRRCATTSASRRRLSFWPA